jgi:hypothetical protein
VWLGTAAVETQGLRAGSLSMITLLLLCILPDGRRAPRCPLLAEFADANPGWYRQTLTALLGSLAAGQLAPLVADRVPLAEAARAHAILEKGDHVGKVVTAAYERLREREAARTDQREQGPLGSARSRSIRRP